ncbi:MAG: DUF3352 domain-containing protein [Kiritimatiellae bacterium]|nr:DUF3352 domain-containing protein [Kiritimatiellia bacterium]
MKKRMAGMLAVAVLWTGLAQAQALMDPAEQMPSKAEADATYLALRGPESFMDRLDADADFVFYLNTAKLIGPVRQEMSALADALKAANFGGPMVGSFMAQVDPVLDWLGFFSIRSVGVSMAPAGEGVSRIKSFIERAEREGNPVMWRLYGEAKPLDTLKYLPEETAAMEVLGLNPATVWAAVEEGVNRFAPGQASGMVAQWKEKLQADYDVDFDALLASLDDEMFMALTLSDSVTMSIPLPGSEPLVIAEPGFLFGVKAQDDSLQRAVLAVLNNRQIPVSEKTLAGGGVLYSVNIPAQMPFPMNVSMLMHEGCLLLGSTPALIERALESYAAGGALVQSEAFQARFPERPARVNALIYMDERFSETYCRLQAALAGMNAHGAGQSPALSAYMDYYVEHLILANRANYYTGYEVYDSFGATSVSFVKTPYGNPLVLGVVSPIAAGFMIGVSTAEKARMASEQMALMEEEYPEEFEGEYDEEIVEEFDTEYYDVDNDDAPLMLEEDVVVEYEYDVDEVIVP